jgi:GTPase SAR1 family protein
MLLDTSSIDFNVGSKEAEDMTNHELEKANVVVLVYDVNNIETIRRLKDQWIPRIVKVNEHVRSSF